MQRERQAAEQTSVSARELSSNKKAKTKKPMSQQSHDSRKSSNGMRGSEIDEEEFKSCRSQAEETPPQVQKVNLDIDSTVKEEPQPSDSAY